MPSWKLAGEPGEGWVWPAETKDGHINHDSFKVQHKKALRLSKVRAFEVYSIRHTFLTRLDESGCDAWTLARIAGHSNIGISQRYVLVSGAAWVLFVSLINALVQNLAPDWVRARVLAIFTLVYMGGFALGSAAWGGVAQHQSVRLALIYSGFGTVGSALLALLARLPESTADLSPWNHWRMPVIVKEVSDELLGGPVLVTIEYSVVAELEPKFVKAMRQYARVRRRDGAYQWGIYRDVEVANRYVEIFLVHSWAEHLRQHERQTKGDRELEQRVYSYIAGEPKVRHLLYADSTKR